MDAVFVSFRLEAGRPADDIERPAGTAGTASVTLAPPVPRPYDMNAADTETGSWWARGSEPWPGWWRGLGAVLVCPAGGRGAGLAAAPGLGGLGGLVLTAGW